MTTPERPPLITPRSWDDYHDNIHRRVRNEDMDTSADYSLIAHMDVSQYGEIAEFQARLARGPLLNELGAKSLMLCLIDREINDAFAYLDALSDDGLITTKQSRRLTHPRYQNIGVVKAGYLLGPEDALQTRTYRNPAELHDHAWNPHDTRTQSLAIGSIFLTSD